MDPVWKILIFSNRRQTASMKLLQFWIFREKKLSEKYYEPILTLCQKQFSNFSSGVEISAEKKFKMAAHDPATLMHDMVDKCGRDSFPPEIKLESRKIEKRTKPTFGIRTRDSALPRRCSTIWAKVYLSSTEAVVCTWFNFRFSSILSIHTDPRGTRPQLFTGSSNFWGLIRGFDFV